MSIQRIQNTNSRQNPSFGAYLVFRRPKGKAAGVASNLFDRKTLSSKYGLQVESISGSNYRKPLEFISVEGDGQNDILRQIAYDNPYMPAMLVKGKETLLWATSNLSGRWDRVNPNYEKLTTVRAAKAEAKKL